MRQRRGCGAMDWPNGNIRKIIVCHGNVVDSLVISDIKHGLNEVSIKFGGPSGDNQDVTIDIS